MPVSMVCESTASAVNAAIRDSLGCNVEEGRTGHTPMHSNNNAGFNASGSYGSNRNAPVNSDDDDEDDNNLQQQIVANAKRVLLSSIDFEEVDDYRQSVLENLKGKYIVLQPDNNNSNNKTNNGANGYSNGNNTTAATSSENVNQHSRSKSPSSQRQQHQQHQPQEHQPNTQNPNELPQPRYVLYPRDKVCVGWNPNYKWNVGVGMMNVGNTCYLNSTLQALFHVPSLANWLLSDMAHMERCEAADIGCIICAMTKTLQSSQSQASCIRPYLVYSKLKTICKHMIMGRQEDAHEFLRFLVESMEKSYLSRFRHCKDLDQYSKETTPLNQILGGYIKTAVRCLSCNHVSVTFQHFQDLLLDIRKADTIEEALDGYFSRERLEDTGYKCEACKKKVSATKQFLLERAPIALCIQLKRFNMLGSKINKQIAIKPRLDLSKYASRKLQASEPLTYKLVAMVTHLGASQHCGHYTAIGLTESGTYYNYDDSYVRPISIQSVCNTSAYIIFYEMDSLNTNLKSTSPSTSTQTSICLNNGDIGMGMTNGKVLNSSNMIGPQMPEDGLDNYTAQKTTMNGNGNGNGTLIPQPKSPNVNKITIHFRNGQHKLVKITNPNSTATSLPSPNGGSTQNNGLIMGTGKFQESAHPQRALASSSNKGKTATFANGYKSSSANATTSTGMYNHGNSNNSNNNSNINSSDEEYVDDDVKYNGAASDYENDDKEGYVRDNQISSPNQNQRKLGGASISCKLPSMPNLYGQNDTASNGCLNNGKKSNNNHNTQMKQALKSLVPYECGTDEDDATTSPHKYAHKRSCSESSDDEKLKQQNNGYCKAKKLTNGNYHDSNSNNNSIVSTTKKSNNNNNKYKTDAITEIFNSAPKRNHNAATTKKSQPMHHQKSQLSYHNNEDSKNNQNSDEDDNDDDNDENTSGCSRTNGRSFKRPQKTPPSPPVVKSKVGIWQVTQNDDIAENKSTATQSISKNLKNPFNTKNDNNSKRPKMNGNMNSKQEKRIGNGYQPNASSDDTVNSLLRQSHRGYGAPVLTWNGKQTEIEKESLNVLKSKQQLTHTTTTTSTTIAESGLTRDNNCSEDDEANINVNVVDVGHDSDDDIKSIRNDSESFIFLLSNKDNPQVQTMNNAKDNTNSSSSNGCGNGSSRDSDSDYEIQKSATTPPLEYSMNLGYTMENYSTTFETYKRSRSQVDADDDVDENSFQ